MPRPRRSSPGRVAGLSLGALGIVYGDIGTSPLYALRESFTGHGHHMEVTDANVLGVLSLIFWSLIIVISLKYLSFVMRADNDGEGGLMALTALATPPDGTPTRRRWVLLAIGLFGTALLYGDGMITPAISVLSAVEGTAVVTEAFAPYVVPLAVVIIVALFAVQQRGTGAVGRVFGPVMILWFTTLGVLGVMSIVDNPQVMQALAPIHLVRFLADNTVTGFLVLGSVFLVVTGGEALYADMGHFGRTPITIGWYGIVLPGLMLNYLGQGALLLAAPEAIDNPFYRLAPRALLVPMVILATAASVIASQALITGAFSMTRQAIHLGYLPRLRVFHTSASERGQIYMPSVQWALMIACVGLVIGFRTSTNLAAAYGVAVTMTMAITTILFYVVIRERFEWPRGAALFVTGIFFAVDLAFLGANIPKVPHGGWFPLVAGAIIFTVLTTWRTGRRLVTERMRAADTTLQAFADQLTERPVHRVPGTAVYMSSIPGAAPPALRTNLAVQGTLHEHIAVVSVSTADIPKIQRVYRLRRTPVGAGIEYVDVKFGFTDEPDIPAELRFGRVIGTEQVTYFLGAEFLAVSDRPGMAKWREQLYAFLHRNASPATSHFHLPHDRTVGVGAQVEL